MKKVGTTLKIKYMDLVFYENLTETESVKIHISGRDILFIFFDNIISSLTMQLNGKHLEYVETCSNFALKLFAHSMDTIPSLKRIHDRHDLAYIDILLSDGKNEFTKRYHFPFLQEELFEGSEIMSNLFQDTEMPFEDTLLLSISGTNDLEHYFNLDAESDRTILEKQLALIYLS